jgi:hypothetical protein
LIGSRPATRLDAGRVSDVVGGLELVREVGALAEILGASYARGARPLASLRAAFRVSSKKRRSICHAVTRIARFVSSRVS